MGDGARVDAVAAGTVASGAGLRDAPRAAAGQPLRFDAASVQGERVRCAAAQRRVPARRTLRRPRNMTLAAASVDAAYGAAAPQSPLLPGASACPGWVGSPIAFDIGRRPLSVLIRARLRRRVGRYEQASSRLRVLAGRPLRPDGAHQDVAGVAVVRAGRDAADDRRLEQRGSRQSASVRRTPAAAARQRHARRRIRQPVRRRSASRSPDCARPRRHLTMDDDRAIHSSLERRSIVPVLNRTRHLPGHFDSESEVRQRQRAPPGRPARARARPRAAHRPRRSSRPSQRAARLEQSHPQCFTSWHRRRARPDAD